MLIIVKYTVINLLKERANTMDGKEIKMKWRMDDEFINFLKKFEKIGEIEKGTVLMGVENYDFEGCLTYVKLYFICDEKEADAFRFYDKSYTRSHIKGYRSFKDDLKKEKELITIYESKYGPMTLNSPVQTNIWLWNNSPWPWEVQK